MATDRTELQDLASASREKGTAAPMVIKQQGRYRLGKSGEVMGITVAGED